METPRLLEEIKLRVDEILETDPNAVLLILQFIHRITREVVADKSGHFH